jgi:uncharacterized protein
MLKDKLKSDLTEAMKASKKDVVEVLRSTLTAITVKEKEQGTELTDGEVFKVVIKQVKDRRNSIEQFVAGNRPDLAEKEQMQIDILSVYLPKPMDAAQVEAAVKGIIEAGGYTGKANMRTVISEFEAKYPAQADGKVISGIAARML